MASLRVRPETPSLDEITRQILRGHLSSSVAVICSAKSSSQLRKATAIADYLKATIDPSRTHLITYDDSGTQPEWLERARELDCSKFIFVEMPPLRRKWLSGRRGSHSPGSNPEQEFMARGRWKVNDVVVIVQPSTSSLRANHRPTDHYLERFLQLDFSRDPKWLAEAALSVIAGVCM